MIRKKENRPEAADCGRSNLRDQRRIDFLRSTRLWIIASVAATGEDRGMTTDRTELEGHDTVVRGTAMPFTDDPFTATDTWTYGRATPLDNINLTVLMLDGVQAGGHCRVVAVGIDTTGAKYPLGLWESSRDLVLCQNSAQPASTKELRLSKSG